MRFKEAPTNTWTSLIGSSPGHMLSGRQSHVNLKSKEAWFYEHLPVLALAINLFWRKTCYWTQILFSQNNNRCYSLAFSLNCICFWNILIGYVFPMRTYWSSRLYFRDVNHMLAVTFRNGRKAKLCTFQLKGYAAINMITYCLVRS